MPSLVILEASRGRGHRLTDGRLEWRTLDLGTGPPPGATEGTLP